MKRLSDESLKKLTALFAEQAAKGSTIFHQAHAEELLMMATELADRRADVPSYDQEAVSWAFRKLMSVGAHIGQGESPMMMDRLLLMLTVNSAREDKP